VSNTRTATQKEQLLSIPSVVVANFRVLRLTDGGAMQQQSRFPQTLAAPNPGLKRLEFRALGTQCVILYAEKNAAQGERFSKAATDWVNRFEARYSRFRDDSLVGRINAAAGGDFVAVDAEMDRMLDLCNTVHQLSRGLLDPTVLPLLRAWDYRNKPARLPSEEEIRKAQSLVGWVKVERRKGQVRLPLAGMALDFGGFGKEWAVDAVALLAAEQGLPAALVDFGHDIRAHGTPPGRPAWHVGVEDPAKPGSSAFSLALGAGMAVAGSGDYLRFFELEGKRYGHIIDPRTGRPLANGCIQSTVVAGSCLLAGIFSTSSLMLGIPAGLKMVEEFPGADAFILTTTARAQTRGFWRHQL